METLNLEKQVKIDYTNYRGERRIREIIPKQIVFSSTEYHKNKQWLLEAFDIEKNAIRLFAVKDIHGFI